MSPSAKVAIGVVFAALFLTALVTFRTSLSEDVSVGTQPLPLREGRSAPLPSSRRLRDMPLPPPRSQPGDNLPADAPGGAQALVNSLPPPGRGEREGWRPLRPRKATGEAEVAAVPLPGGGRIGPGASGDSSDSGSSQAQPQPNFGPIVLGPGPQSAPPINELVGPDGQEQILVAMRRLRDSGALHRLTPQELLHVTELMPNSAGVRDANRIVQEQLGISLDEFLSRYLPH